ncbi:MAG: M23 family metallopeptidase [Jatrophihabitantaceae bacterium]
MPRVYHRGARVLAGLLTSLLLASFAVVAGSGSASASVPPPNPAHLYSDPIWVPIHTAFRAGCIGSSTSNNGPRSGANHCSHDHVGYFSMNLSIPWKVTGGRVNPVPHPPVYAAGAGVVIRASTGHAACARSGPVYAGNEVWIAHSGGVVSVYQHLLAVYVRVGSKVTARTAIGTAGATGAACDAHGKPPTAYLDFQVRRNGGQYQTPTAVSVPVLLGCSGTSTKAVAWPAAISRSMYVMPAGQRVPNPLPRTWLQVPFGAGIQTTSSQWNCVRANGSGAATPATGLRLTRSGTTRTLSWNVEHAANRYEVQVQVLRGRAWVSPCSSWLRSCNSGYYTLTATSSPHFRMTGMTGRTTYRLQVCVHNVIGWSSAGRWVTVR